MPGSGPISSEIRMPSCLVLSGPTSRTTSPCGVCVCDLASHLIKANGLRPGFHRACTSPLQSRPVRSWTGSIVARLGRDILVVGGPCIVGLPEEVSTVRLYHDAELEWPVINPLAFKLGHSLSPQLLTVVPRSVMRIVIPWACGIEDFPPNVPKSLPDVTWDKMLVDARPCEMDDEATNPGQRRAPYPVPMRLIVQWAPPEGRVIPRPGHGQR